MPNPVNLCPTCGRPMVDMELCRKVYDAYRRLHSFAQAGRELGISRMKAHKMYHKYLRHVEKERK